MAVVELTEATSGVGYAYDAGTLVDVPDAKAARLVEAGRARAVDDADPEAVVVYGTRPRAPGMPEHHAERIRWIGSDVERARQALDDEDTRERPRVSVVEHARTLLEGAGG